MDKLEKIKSIRKKLINNIPSVGSWLQIPHPTIAEIFGKNNYDWIGVDLEHGSISINDLPDIFRAIELGGTLPLVRLSSDSHELGKKVLDAGAAGVIVPMVSSEKDIRDLIKSLSWPPNGTRGVGYSRANLFGREFDNYNEFAQNPLVIAQIEHINAIRKLDKIISVNGLDAVFLGPYDLSASMGMTGDFTNPRFESTIKSFVRTCKNRNFPAGIHIIRPDKNELQSKINEGFLFIAYSIDTVFLTKDSKNPITN